MSLQDTIKCTDLLAEKDAIIAERDEWKAIAQSYDGCLEGIALKIERKKAAELVLENRAYDLRMDNDGKRIAELEAEIATVKESLTTAEATIDKLRDAIKGVGQFGVTGCGVGLSGGGR